MTEPLLVIRDLHVAPVADRELEILQGIDLTVDAGEVHAIMGPNGSGKTTLAYALMGHPAYVITSGEVRFKGMDLLALSADKRARAGLYQRIEVNRGLPARLMIKYLVRHEDEWEIKTEIRAMCQFQQRNLLGGATPGWRFDFIFLRNVMIYFPEEQRQQVLKNMHSSLRPDGALILGVSEQPRLDSHWQTVPRPNCVWYRPV